jgi:hypothetical protein
MNRGVAISRFKRCGSGEIGRVVIRVETATVSAQQGGGVARRRCWGSSLKAIC